jgi:hypothetical protein
VPGEPVALRFCLTPHPYVVKRGERLRIDMGSRTDLLLSNTSQGRSQFGMQAPPYVSRNTLHHGAETYTEVHKVPAFCESRQLSMSHSTRAGRRNSEQPVGSTESAGLSKSRNG